MVSSFHGRQICAEHLRRLVTGATHGRRQRITKLVGMACRPLAQENRMTSREYPSRSSEEQLRRLLDRSTERRPTAAENELLEEWFNSGSPDMMTTSTAAEDC